MQVQHDQPVSPLGLDETQDRQRNRSSQKPAIQRPVGSGFRLAQPLTACDRLGHSPEVALVSRFPELEFLLQQRGSAGQPIGLRCPLVP